jgi:hypothetical protein
VTAWRTRRFVDFRTLFTQGKKLDHDWYCLHGCQTNHPSLDYLRQVRAGSGQTK